VATSVATFSTDIPEVRATPDCNIQIPDVQTLPMTVHGPGIIEYQPIDPGNQFRGRRTATLVLGILAVVIGAGSGCMGALIPFAMIVLPKSPNAPAQPAGTMIGAMLIYLVAASCLIWWGVGAMQMRRWVRPMALTVATMVTAGAIFWLIAMSIALPGLIGLAGMPAPRWTPNPPAGFFVGMLIGMMMVGLLSVIVPGTYVWFFKNARTREMLEYFDPVPRWTDGCPIPVLGLVIGLLLYAISALIMLPMSNQVFGSALSGSVSALLLFASVLVAGVTVPLVYHRRPVGWWITLGLILFWHIGYAIMALGRRRAAIYRQAGYSAAQLQLVERTSRTWVYVMFLPLLVILVGYMLYVRRYFTNGDTALDSALPSPKIPA